MKRKLTIDAWDTFRPNPWNPNRMNEEQFAAAYTSIRLHGFIVPVVARAASTLTTDDVRAIVNRVGNNVGALAGMTKAWLKEYLSKEHTYEIIDGEHRWAAVHKMVQDINAGEVVVVKAKRGPTGYVHLNGKPLRKNQIARQAANTFMNDGTIAIPAIVLDKLGTAEAKWLTVVLNETRGTVDPRELGRLLHEVGESVDLEELAQELPFTVTDLEDLMTIGEFDFEAIEKLREQAAKEAENKIEEEDWIRFKVQMQPDEADLFRQALALVNDQLQADGYKLHEKDELANGQVLELIAADLMAAR